MTIAIVDYGAGNLRSVQLALERVAAPSSIARRAADLDAADAVVLPGVGHFQTIAARLDAGWRGALRSWLDAGQPFLGICLGMQFLFEGSDEAPQAAGLGVLPGRCFRLPDAVRVPHVGWNTLDPASRPSRLLADVPADASAYFTHTFAAPLGADTTATTDHGIVFTAAIERGRLFGTQFHPEKSGATGLRVLRNFVQVVRGAA